MPDDVFAGKEWREQEEKRKAQERKFATEVIGPALERAEKYLAEDKPFHAIAVLLAVQVAKEVQVTA